MIFQFQAKNINFFDEDKAYFEEKIGLLSKFLGNEAGDNDSIHVHIALEKNNHQSGERFEAKGHMTTPHHGDFFAEVSSENIRGCADLLEEKLKTQVKKFHDKH